jgi:hypothetical protein
MATSKPMDPNVNVYIFGHWAMILDSSVDRSFALVRPHGCGR